MKAPKTILKIKVLKKIEKNKEDATFLLESKGRKNATHCYIKYMLVLCYLTKLSIMNQNLHLTAFEARMSKIKVLAEAISDEGCCLCLTQHLCA